MAALKFGVRLGTRAAASASRAAKVVPVKRPPVVKRTRPLPTPVKRPPVLKRSVAPAPAKKPPVVKRSATPAKKPPVVKRSATPAKKPPVVKRVSEAIEPSSGFVAPVEFSEAIPSAPTITGYLVERGYEPVLGDWEYGSGDGVARFLVTLDARILKGPFG